ncbi:ArsR/SmtB family transcription factor [Halorarum halobium]|uniref:ArsR/SmtB family transcription factor n=1 Tax=Halorarum halobium TaxID=3075121 RepID=UPI0028AC8237|nr:helix-turn-helix domain-containing protein [Halobaculum sp. XH14]
MASPLTRLGGRTDSADAAPRVLPVDDEETDDVIEALGSGTARELFRAVHADPAPPSELARRVDTSVQNVHYHLTNLEAAGLVESLGRTYSEKGNEMTVYGPAAEPIVLTAEPEPDARGELDRLLGDWASGVAALGLASLAVQLAVERLVGTTPVELFEPASRAAGDPNWVVGVALTAAQPGVLFFVGGLVTFALAAYRDRDRSPSA